MTDDRQAPTADVREAEPESAWQLVFDEGYAAGLEARGLVLANADDPVRVAVDRVRLRMLRRQDGCEQAHRGNDWHVHEQAIADYETALRAALAASGTDR